MKLSSLIKFRSKIDIDKRSKAEQIIGESDPDSIRISTSALIKKDSLELDQKTAVAKNDDHEDPIEDLITKRRMQRAERSVGFCAHCGNPIQRSDKFCPKCGMKQGK